MHDTTHPRSTEARNKHLWVFNIRQYNWPACRSGPDDPAVHGDHVGQPWQGVGDSARFSPRQLRAGDIVVARRVSRGGDLPHGAMAVWEFDESARVTDQNDVPWTDNTYRWVLYCKEIQTLESPITERFSSLPFHQNKFFGAVTSLKGEPKRAYIDRLLGAGRLGSRARSALQTIR